MKTAFLLSLALILLRGAEWKVHVLGKIQDFLSIKSLWQRIIEERNLEVTFFSDCLKAV